jgi:hypothetical protein
MLWLLAPREYNLSIPNKLKFISVFSQVNIMGDSTAQQLLVLMPSENCSFLDYIAGQETEFLLIYQNFIV